MKLCHALPKSDDGVFLAVSRQGEVLFSSSGFSALPEKSSTELSQESLISICRRVANTRSRGEVHECSWIDASGIHHTYRCVVRSEPVDDARFAAAAVCFCQDETEIHQEKELEYAISILNATLDSTADGIMVVDAKGLIVSFNQRLLDIWSIPRSAIEGRFYKEVLAEVLDQLANPEECIKKLEEIMTDPDSFSHDVLKFKRGRILERFSRPQRLAGKAIGRVFSYRDITDKVQAEESAREKANRLKTLAETSRIVAEARLDLQSVLENATRTVADFFQDGCTISLIAKRGFEFDTVSFFHSDREVHQTLNSAFKDAQGVISDTVASEVVRSQKPLLLSGSTEEMHSKFSPQLQKFLTGYPIHSLIVTPLRVTGELTGFMIVFRFKPGQFSSSDVEFMQDMSDRMALAISNAILHLQTRDALRLRDDFIRLASHELRTPLTTLTLQIQYLTREARNDPHRWGVKRLVRVLENASKAVDRLGDLIREILEMADLASGNVSLVREKVDLSVLLKEIVERYRFRTAAAHYTIEFKADRPIYASLDPARTRESIQHLLSAAIPRGKRKIIHVGVWREGDKAALGIRVGAHRTHEDQFRSLGEFQRAMIVEQLGLGVYLANEIIEAHGGWLRIYGDLKNEFSFIVKLPVEASEQSSGPEPVRISA